MNLIDLKPFVFLEICSTIAEQKMTFHKFSFEKKKAIILPKKIGKNRREAPKIGRNPREAPGNRKNRCEAPKIGKKWRGCRKIVVQAKK